MREMDSNNRNRQSNYILQALWCHEWRHELVTKRAKFKGW